MQANINEQRRKRRRKAILGVVGFALLQVLCAALFCALCFIPDLPRWAVTAFAVLAITCILPLGSALVVLYQRFKEIEGGELDAAAQY